MALYYDVESYGAIADWGAGRTGTILEDRPTELRINSAGQLCIGQKIAIAGIGTRTIVDVTPNKVIIDPPGKRVTDAAVYTDNYDAFVAALAAMRADQNAVRKLVARGWFYIGQTLTIAQTVHLEGVGDARADLHNAKVGSRSNPGTWLLFPKNVDGLRIKSSMTGDPGGQEQSAERTKLKNFTISCIDPTTTSGHGIFSTVIFDAECVTVEGFGGNGFHLTGWANDFSGTPMLSSLWNCFTLNNNDGFHLEGTQCGACRVLLCNAMKNRAVGFYDHGGISGTSYAFCHANSNGTYNYQTLGGIPRVDNFSTFLHCYNEGSKNCSLMGTPMVIGGNLTSEASTDTSTPFEILGGVASKRPFEYWNYGAERGVRSRLGEKANETGMSFLSLDVLGPGRDAYPYDHSELRYGGDAQPWLIWRNDNTGDRECMRLPTKLGTVRAPAPWFSNGIYLGATSEITGIGGIAQVRFTASRGIPSVQREKKPLTYEIGDTVWEADPNTRTRLARRCIAAGTLSMTAALPKGKVDNPGTLIIDPPTGLAVGQYISVDGLDDGAAKKITRIDGEKVTYRPPKGTVGAGALISFAAPEFETLYAANGPTVTAEGDVMITAEQRFVTVTASGKTVKLPNAPSDKIPFDGETHEIKGNGEFAVTISGNGANIDGAAIYTQSTYRSNTRVRFNGTSGEWEIR